MGYGTASQKTVFPASGSSCRSCGVGLPSQIPPSGMARHFLVSWAKAQHMWDLTQVSKHKGLRDGSGGAALSLGPWVSAAPQSPSCREAANLATNGPRSQAPALDSEAHRHLGDGGDGGPGKLPSAGLPSEVLTAGAQASQKWRQWPQVSSGNPVQLWGVLTDTV